MEGITDEELVAAIEQRLKDKQQALGESEDLLKQLKHANRQLEAAEKLKTRFLSNIRNEINNPFWAILCLSENIMQLDASQFDKVYAMTSLIHQEAFKLHFQLQNIFTAADLEAGEVTLAPTQVDVFNLIQHVVTSLGPTILQKSLRMSVHENPIHPENQRSISTDASKLHLILSNLLSNAIRFSEQGESIELTWSIREDGLRLRLTDHGPGIEEQHQEAIFNRFTQLEATSTRLHGGHGLGLSIVKALLELIGGSIVVNSVLRQGSVFTVNIPRLLTADREDAFSEGESTLFFDSTDWQDEKR